MISGRVLLTLWFCSRLLSAVPQADNEELGRKAVEAERQGDFSGALAAFRALLSNGVDNPELRSNLGIVYFQLHDFHRALQELQSALAKSPDSVPANLFSGLSLLHLQRPQAALPYLQKAHRLQPDDATSVLALARVEIAVNHPSRAHEFYGEAARLDPQNAEAWYGLGITDRVLAERELKLSNHSGKESRTLMDASTQAISKAMQIDPGSVRARMVMGESFRIAERYDLAVQEYQAATAQQPGLAAAWAGLAAAYSASGDDPNALAAATHALQLEPEDAGTNGLIAGTYLRMSDYAKADTYVHHALRLQPDLASARVVLAKIYLARQQPQKALLELQLAVQDDTEGATYYLLATTLRQIGKPAEAAAAMQQYQKLHNARLAVNGQNVK